jgi:hypothetical protein
MAKKYNLLNEEIYMKKVYMILCLALFPPSTINASQAASTPSSTKSWALPIAALIGGTGIACWVGKHWWDKHKLESAKNEILNNKTLKDDYERGGGLGVASGFILGAAYSISKEKLDNRFRERHKYPCLALAATGLGAAAWGLKTLWTINK